MIISITAMFLMAASCAIPKTDIQTDVQSEDNKNHHDIVPKNQQGLSQENMMKMNQQCQSFVNDRKICGQQWCEVLRIQLKG